MLETSSPAWRVVVRPSLLLLLAAVFTLSPRALVAEEAAAVEARLRDAVTYLASDAMEGRGIGTKGLDLAADYLAQQFEEIGLETEVFDGGPFQKFSMSTGAEMGSGNTLALVKRARSGDPTESQRIELRVREDYNPMAVSGSKVFDLPLVFVGYGITAKKEGYDDYQDVDVEGRAVIILRKEPQQGDLKSVFAGTKNSEYAPFRRKISNAYEHGAAAVIFCEDYYGIRDPLAAERRKWRIALRHLAQHHDLFQAIDEPTEDQWQKRIREVTKLTDEFQAINRRLAKVADPILSFGDLSTENAGSEHGGRDFPVLYCRRAALDKAIRESLGTDLATLEASIDKGLKPASRALEGWNAVGKTHVRRREVEVKNVVGVFPGEGALADETVVIGAHYDHLGWGGASSAARGVHEIHNGADDNASGAAVLLEVARRLVAAAPSPRRRVVLIAFTGEERGLIGSARYVGDPPFPLDSTVAMLNMDMVGRLKEDRLLVHGTGTATEFDALVDRVGDELGFDIVKRPEGFGPSDHSSFYSKRIPVLHLFTDLHGDYHRPSDDVDKLNVAGMRRVAQMATGLVEAWATAEKRPSYLETKAPESHQRGGTRPYFGSVPDFGGREKGYALSGVTKGSPAAQAGIRAGDVIVQLGKSRIGNLEDFDSALRKHDGGEKVPVRILRNGKVITVQVTLGAPR